MGALREKVNRLTNLLPDPQGSTVGYVVTVTNYVDERGITQWTYELAAGGGGGGGVTSLNMLTGALSITSLDGSVTIVPSGSTIDLSVPASGGGTVNDFSAGNLSPLFTSSVATSTTTPALTFAQINQSANLIFAGPSSGGAAAPTFRALVAADIPAQSTKKAPGCIFSNGSLLLTGTLTDEIYVPYGGTITDWTILGDASGSASIVVSNATYANYDTMTTLFTATCSTAKKAQATGLSHTLVAGALRFSGSGFSGFTRCSIVLTVQT